MRLAILPSWQGFGIKRITKNVHCEVGLELRLEIKILKVGGHGDRFIEFYTHKTAWWSFNKFI
jgi:hypothetical protein